MKYVLFFIVAFCTVQGFQAQAGQYPEIRAITDVIEVVKDVAGRIKEAVKEIDGRLKQIADNLKERTEEIVSSINNPEIIEQLTDGISKIIADGSKVAEICASAAKNEVEALVKNTEDELKSCVSQTTDRTQALNEQTQTLLQKAHSLKNDVGGRVQKCDDDNKRLADLANCLEAQIKPIKAVLGELLEEIKNTIKVAEAVSADVASTLKECVNQLQDYANVKAKNIIQNVQHCTGEL